MKSILVARVVHMIPRSWLPARRPDPHPRGGGPLPILHHCITAPHPSARLTLPGAGQIHLNKNTNRSQEMTPISKYLVQVATFIAPRVLNPC